VSCSKFLKSITVLLVEDEQNLAELLRGGIGDKFDKFILAHDGEEGLLLAKNINPDIVITDITMPKMDGLKMSALIREKQPNMPIVILSAYSEKDYLLEAIDVGVTKYLIKPFDPDELIEVICKLLKKRENNKRIPLLPPFQYDLTNKKLLKDGIMVRLSKRENQFIYNLISSLDYFMEPENIKASLWDDDSVSDERLRVFINRLRQKTNPDFIGNIVGQGYILNKQIPSKQR
jgi:DNA-binding response OmpR family regulator